MEDGEPLQGSWERMCLFIGPADAEFCICVQFLHAGTPSYEIQAQPFEPVGRVVGKIIAKETPEWRERASVAGQ